MRLISLSFLALVLSVSAVWAQSVMDNLPPVVIEGDSAAVGGAKETAGKEAVPAAPVAGTTAPAVSLANPYTVADVSVDVTAANAAQARDQALMQAERAAYVQLCGRLSVVDNSAKLNDDAIAEMVQSFEVQSEKVSSVRYIGVFTIRFKASAVLKKVGAPVAAAAVPAAMEESAAKPAPLGAVAHLAVAVQTDSLAAWGQIKRRLNAVPQIARIDTIDLGRGVSHVDLSYTGTQDDLRQGVAVQGFILRRGSGGWELYEGSMVPR